jgi:hypothetical protein
MMVGSRTGLATFCLGSEQQAQRRYEVIELILTETTMNLHRLFPIAVGVGLLVSAPAFAQESRTKQHTPDAPSPITGGLVGSGARQNAQYGNSPATGGRASGARKQQTQGELPEVGPASGAYHGNTQHSRY